MLLIGSNKFKNNYMFPNKETYTFGKQDVKIVLWVYIKSSTFQKSLSILYQKIENLQMT